MKNNSPVRSSSGKPNEEDTAIYAQSQKRRAPPPPIAPAKVEKLPPDVGEERLDHMKKMKELKPVMPTLETNYYDQVIQ